LQAYLAAENDEFFQVSEKVKEKEGHIMISYQWDYQDLMVKVGA